MPTMNEFERGLATAKAVELYKFLDKHGEDGDVFGEIFAALDLAVGPRGYLLSANSTKGASDE